ncbi:sulfate adenylyltransferase [Aquisalibacillus elongatus]|uniref:Sulfate adenylyltransferase n=1 Tax=Aquisalibacillus elongatus TaxID=485577 RepID=A0A3N5BT74_9BACI|nr:sulfate adenylyltransferase [Aquisalibacillus elongatus]RPF50702.1 sulfate adenylyltransferase [Aquisalibacillus elongatus]
MAITAHGGQLINRFRSDDDLDSIKTEIIIDLFTLFDLECLAIGAFSPLKGFMTEQDYQSVIHRMRLHNGLLWPIPITLSISKDDVPNVLSSEKVKLVYDQTVFGVMEVSDVFEADLPKEAELVYGTTDLSHPGVKRLFKESPIYVGGNITMVKRPPRIIDEKYYVDPIDTRMELDRRNWRRIVGFQTRNPIHRAHEYIQKSALESMDGLFIHPLVGETKQDDLPPAIRMKSYEVLVNQFYSKNHTILQAYPANMRYAGPREAVFHAIVRQNYGCTHFIVGRDHAGVGDYYGTYDSQKIFEQLHPDDLEIKPLFFEHSFYCKKCQTVASIKTCPHEMEDRLVLSGTKVREMLRKGIFPPSEFSRQEVIEILINGLTEEGQSNG